MLTGERQACTMSDATQKNDEPWKEQTQEEKIPASQPGEQHSDHDGLQENQETQPGEGGQD
jgi:hypothetical protein